MIRGPLAQTRGWALCTRSIANPKASPLFHFLILHHSYEQQHLLLIRNIANIVRPMQTHFSRRKITSSYACMFFQIIGYCCDMIPMICTSIHHCCCTVLLYSAVTVVVFSMYYREGGKTPASTACKKMIAGSKTSCEVTWDSKKDD